MPGMLGRRGGGKIATENTHDGADGVLTDRVPIRASNRGETISHDSSNDGPPRYLLAGHLPHQSAPRSMAPGGGPENGPGGGGPEEPRILSIYGFMYVSTHLIFTTSCPVDLIIQDVDHRLQVDPDGGDSSENTPCPRPGMVGG